MLSVAHLLAAGSHEAVSSGNPALDLANQFGFELPMLLAQIVSFSVVAFILYRMAFKPVLETMETRKSQIESGLKYAEQMKVKLAEAEAEKKRVLQEASLEAKNIVAEARQSAEARIEKSAQEAIKAAEEITKKAKVQIELDRSQMLAEARSEIARLVVATAAKVLAKDLSADEKSRFAETASSSLVGSSN